MPESKDKPKLSKELQYEVEILFLEMLRDRLKPAFAELRRSPTTLFLLPHMSPLRIETMQELYKPEKPVLICDYGIQQQRQYGNRAKNLRTVITMGEGYNDYVIEEQGLIGKRGSHSKKKVYRWRNDREHSAKNTHTCNLEGAVTYMNNRVEEAYKAHEALMPKRLGKTIGAVALAALFALYYTEAHGVETEDANVNMGGPDYVDDYGYEP